MCECMTWCWQNGSESGGLHHHKNCPKYKTEKFPYLFYYEEAFGYFVLTPDKVENIISTDNLSDGEEYDIRFVRKDMTDQEYSNIPDE